MSAWALALSGGGLRATLFHLGVIKRLRETGDLAKVRHIFSVSGGSILAAHIRLNWDHYSGTDEQFQTAAGEIQALCQRDLRGRVVRRSMLCWLLLVTPSLHILSALPGLGRLRRVARSLAPVGFLVREYDRFYQRRKLPAPSAGAPSLHVLTTSLNTGEICIFEDDHIRLRRPGFTPAPAQWTPMAVAVAASSAYPALFAPLRMDAPTLVVRKDQFPETHYLSDGGLYDNLGLIEALQYENESGVRYDRILIADAGAAMSADTETVTWGFFRRAIRTSDIFMSRIAGATVAATRGGDAPRFNTISIHHFVASSQVTENAQTTIGSVRTDLNAFNRREQTMIINHGYEVCRDVLSPGQEAAARSALPSSETEPLLHSQTPSLWGLLNPRDWSTATALALIVLWIAGAAYAITYRDLKRDYARYKHNEFLRQREVAADLLIHDLASPDWPRQVDRFRMQEFSGAGRYSDLGIASRIPPLRWLTGFHNAVAQRINQSPPFPSLERSDLASARACAGNSHDAYNRRTWIYNYMHLIGNRWREELPQAFKQLRDDSYLQILRLVEGFALSPQVDRTLAAEFDRYYWGRLLPVESRTNEGAESVERAMIRFRVRPATVAS